MKKTQTKKAALSNEQKSEDSTNKNENIGLGRTIDHPSSLILPKEEENTAAKS